MKIFVKAKPNSYGEKVEKIDETHFIAETHQPAIAGWANRAIALLLARHFKVDLAQVRIIKGFKERNKIFEIGKN
jgi:uncharacterized protein YggU (UPF0235/DUF167 family)